MRYKDSLLYGEKVDKLIALNVLGVPSDTVVLDDVAKTFPALAIKDDVLKVWSVAEQAWKTFSGGGGYQEILYADLIALVDAGTVSPGKYYLVTDRGGSGVLLTGLTPTSVSKNGVRFQQCPNRYDVATDAQGNWNGIWSNQIAPPTIGDLYIWGGLVWENLTGSIGTSANIDSLQGPDWNPLYKAANPDYYTIKPFNVIYDAVNDFFEEQRDERGNVIAVDKATWNGLGLSLSPGDYTDWNLPASKFRNNKAWCITNNYCDKIINNDVDYFISGNILGSGSILGNVDKTQGITDNDLDIASNHNIEGNDTSGGINANVFSSSISFNSVRGAISTNTGFTTGIVGNSNNGNIGHNSGTGGILKNSNAGSIVDNISTGVGIRANYNAGDITNNTVDAIENNYAGGDISDNVIGSVNNNLCSSSIVQNAMPGGNISINRCGGLQGNTCLEISYNNNAGAINYNDGDGMSILNNSNAGEISNNVFPSGIVRAIERNTNNGDIIGNSVANGTIAKNSNGGNIESCIITGSGTSIVSNINNGRINVTSAATITDTIVNK